MGGSEVRTWMWEWVVQGFRVLLLTSRQSCSTFVPQIPKATLSSCLSRAFTVPVQPPQHPGTA